MARTPGVPADRCPYCDQATSLQVLVVSRQGRSALVRCMWCASCRGTYLGLRRLLPEARVVDTVRRRARGRFDAEKLRRSIAQPVRKTPADGFRDPFSGEPLPSALDELAGELVLNFAVESLARAAEEPNGDITTDQIALAVLSGLRRLHALAFVRSAVHHRLFPSTATMEECVTLAGAVEALLEGRHLQSDRIDPELPILREPPPPVRCSRCGMPRVSRRSRAKTAMGLEQQAASCGHCGQRFTWEWGSRVPLLVSSDEGDSLFDPVRFRNGIRSAVRKLPGAAVIWSDEMLIASAANSALMSATPFIRPPAREMPVPAIQADDLWLSAAATLRRIHPLAYVRYAVHSGALANVDWSAPENRDALRAIVQVIDAICRRYFGPAAAALPDPAGSGETAAR